ncbi:MAG: hypothetical protein QM765_26170 [Myxococcales bacterium]
MRLLALGFVVVALGLVGGCGGNDQEPGPAHGDVGPGAGLDGGLSDAGGKVTCSTAATIAVSTDPTKILTATGTITCPGAADLAIQVCAQLDGVDVQCASQSGSGLASLTNCVQVSCLGTKTFRARVMATVDGTDSEVFSGEQTIQCR